MLKLTKRKCKKRRHWFMTCRAYDQTIRVYRCCSFMLLSFVVCLYIDTAFANHYYFVRCFHTYEFSCAWSELGFMSVYSSSHDTFAAHCPATDLFLRVYINGQACQIFANAKCLLPRWQRKFSRSGGQTCSGCLP